MEVYQRFNLIEKFALKSIGTLLNTLIKPHYNSEELLPFKKYRKQILTDIKKFFDDQYILIGSDIAPQHIAMLDLQQVNWLHGQLQYNAETLKRFYMDLRMQLPAHCKLDENNSQLYDICQQFNNITNSHLSTFKRMVNDCERQRDDLMRRSFSQSDNDGIELNENSTLISASAPCSDETPTPRTSTSYNWIFLYSGNDDFWFWYGFGDGISGNNRFGRMSPWRGGGYGDGYVTGELVELTIKASAWAAHKTATGAARIYNAVAPSIQHFAHNASHTISRLEPSAFQHLFNNNLLSNIGIGIEQFAHSSGDAASVMLQTANTDCLSILNHAASCCHAFVHMMTSCVHFDCGNLNCNDSGEIIIGCCGAVGAAIYKALEAIASCLHCGNSKPSSDAATLSGASNHIASTKTFSVSKAAGAAIGAGHHHVLEFLGIATLPVEIVMGALYEIILTPNLFFKLKDAIKKIENGEDVKFHRNRIITMVTGVAAGATGGALVPFGGPFTAMVWAPLFGWVPEKIYSRKHEGTVEKIYRCDKPQHYRLTSEQLRTYLSKNVSLTKITNTINTLEKQIKTAKTSAIKNMNWFSWTAHKVWGYDDKDPINYNEELAKDLEELKKGEYAFSNV